MLSVVNFADVSKANLLERARALQHGEGPSPYEGFATQHENDRFIARLEPAPGSTLRELRQNAASEAKEHEQRATGLLWSAADMMTGIPFVAIPIMLWSPFSAGVNVGIVCALGVGMFAGSIISALQAGKESDKAQEAKTFEHQLQQWDKMLHAPPPVVEDSSMDEVDPLQSEQAPQPVAVVVTSQA
jgi:hypothetical protein